MQRYKETQRQRTKVEKDTGSKTQRDKYKEIQTHGETKRGMVTKRLNETKT